VHALVNVAVVDSWGQRCWVTLTRKAPFVFWERFLAEPVSNNCIIGKIKIW